MTTTAKITLATVKAFIKKNADSIFILEKSTFDGMVDGVRNVPGGAKWVKPEGTLDLEDKATLGFRGVWFVRGSRDYFNAYNQDGYVGYEVSNCCGSWTVAVKA